MTRTTVSPRISRITQINVSVPQHDVRPGRRRPDADRDFTDKESASIGEIRGEMSTDGAIMSRDATFMIGEC